MMKVKVTAHFRDIETREHYEVGQVLTLSEARAQAVVAKGCGEIVPEKRKRGRPPKNKAVRPTEDK